MKAILRFSGFSIMGKSIVFSSIVILPLWFLILALHFANFISLEWNIILGLCLVPSLVWFALTFLSYYIFDHFLGNNAKMTERHFKRLAPIGLDIAAYALLIGFSYFIIRFSFEFFLLLLFSYKILSIPLLKKVANRI